MKTFTFIAAASCLGLFSFAGLVTAQDRTVPQTADTLKGSASSSVQPDYVVEFFTSQGCSSCPPAYKFAAKFAQSHEEALVLNYAVTYWDYLGWKDTFGDPSFTQRQRDYGRSLGAQNIYTPQIVLNGAAHSPRYSSSDVTSMPLSKSRPEASLTLRADGKLLIEAALPANYGLSLIRYTPGLQEVAVKRGENGGRHLNIENVVDEVQTPKWDGRPLVLNASLKADQTYAVLFHEPDSVKIVTAAVLKR